jgi:hypothetical protein
VLVIVVVTVVRGLPADKPAPPAVATTMMPTMPPPPAWQPAAPQIVIQQPEPERPLRRVAAAFTELGDSVIKVFR